MQENLEESKAKVDEISVQLSRLQGNVETLTSALLEQLPSQGESSKRGRFKKAQGRRSRKVSCDVESEDDE